MGLMMIAGFIAVGVNRLVTGQETIENSPLFQIYILVLIISYFFYFWHRSGQTVGMKAWRIKLISQDQTPLTVKKMSIRIIVAVPSFCLLLIGVLWQYLDKSDLNWQDHASQTKLIYMPKK